MARGTDRLVNIYSFIYSSKVADVLWQLAGTIKCTIWVS